MCVEQCCHKWKYDDRNNWCLGIRWVLLQHYGQGQCQSLITLNGVGRAVDSMWQRADTQRWTDAVGRTALAVAAVSPPLHGALKQCLHPVGTRPRRSR